MSEIQNILIIGNVWPEPTSSAAGSRTIQLIELFQQLNWKITFACAASKSDFMYDLSEFGVNQVSIQLNNSSFDEFIKTLRPTIVMFDRFMIEEQFGWRVAENCPNALRILDTSDLRTLRFARQEAFKEKRTFTYEDLLSDFAKREIASIYRSDCSIMISTFEMDLLQQFFKIDSRLLHYTPFLLNKITSEQTLNWPTFEERQHFVTIGNFLHEPNWNSVMYLKEEIWPLIRKHLPEAELHVYGAYATQKVTQLHQPKDGFLIKGRADNAHEVMLKSRVCLAPLRFGAGLKGKLIDAMEAGTPSITTTIGAEAMTNSLPWGGEITDDTSTFATEAINLYLNKETWLQAQSHGVSIINQVFDKNLHSQLLLDKITNLLANLKHHRDKNFIGSILMHHSLSSTKYMARWIEEKEKSL